MRPRTGRVWGLAVAVVVALVVGAHVRAQDAAVTGTWTGTIATPGAPLNIAITLRQDSGGAWTGTMDIPAQGARGLPLGDVAVKGRDVAFRLLAGAGTPAATARVSDDGTRLSGTFTQGGASFPLELARSAGDAPAPPRRPQEPRPPFPYRAEEVSYRNEAAGIRLAGTLTLPQGAGPFPAVVLITGSGAQDRDETIAGHKPFLVIADYLTRRGIAVLRVDDRGVGGSDLGSLTATSLDFDGDVRAGLAYLRGRQEIDASRLGLIGHSEGANIAAIVAADVPDLRFIVMLAGAGLPGDEILYLQAAQLGRLQGAAADVVAWDRRVRQSVYELIKSEQDGVPDETRRQALIERTRPPPGAADATAGRALTTALLKAGSGAWFRHFLAYDPASTLARMRVPALVLFGGNDVQVPAAENAAAVTKALDAGGHRDYRIEILPGLNHLFQTSKTGSPAEYAQIEETVAPAALEMMADWLEARTGR